MVIATAVAKHSTPAIGEKSTMDKFKFWASEVEKSLKPSHPKLKHCNACEILAAAFGHNTYASFHLNDEDAINGNAKYILLDDKLPIIRAKKLGFNLSDEEWTAAITVISRSGNSRCCWLVEASSMFTAARIIFEDSPHQKLDDIQLNTTNMLGKVATNIQCFPPQDPSSVNWYISPFGGLLEKLEFMVEGEAHAWCESSAIAVPLKSLVIFERIGKRIYSEGRLITIEQSGASYEFEPEFENDFCYFSED